jgi:hypothetical protein
VVAAARAAGVEPVGRRDEDDGRFAWLIDPAGVKVELWEPLGPSPGVKQGQALRPAIAWRVASSDWPATMPFQSSASP